jgi:hypothetical protein
MALRNKELQLALPVQVQGTGIHRQHRFGRHATKQERRASDRDKSFACAEVGKDVRHCRWRRLPSLMQWKGSCHRQSALPFKAQFV